MKLVFVASLLWCLAGLGVLLSWDFFRDFNPSIGIVVLMLFTVLIGLTRWLLGRKHQGVLVFWCRRFGDTETLAGHLNRWHGRIIDEASRGFALPVTLQDESVDTPPLVSTAVFFPVFLVMMLGSLGSSLWLFDLPWFDTTVGNIAGFVMVVLAITAPSVVAVLVCRWLGENRVVPGTVARVALRAMRTTRSRRGLVVLKCASENWQECVAELLGSVSLAIIDVSVLSENVEWEIETAVEHLGSRRVLLLAAENRVGQDIEKSQTERWVLLRYDIKRATDELNSFSESWREDKHQFVDPDASLGSFGKAVAAAITEWMENATDDQKRVST